MAYNTKAIKKDVNNHPVPQYYNPAIDDYEPLQGVNGAHRVLLFDTNGNPLLTASNPGNVQIVNSFATIKAAPVVGAKTVTTMAAEIFAGASRKSGRYLMSVFNESSVPVYWGPSSVTTSNGYPLLPGDSVVFRFDPSVATAIYFVASANASVRVVEL
nr:MAG: hypothetical protein DIU81_08870 [[Clostridium] cellulosi]